MDSPHGESCMCSDQIAALVRVVDADAGISLLGDALLSTSVPKDLFPCYRCVPSDMARQGHDFALYWRS
jgi:hypothetical protein